MNPRYSQEEEQQGFQHRGWCSGRGGIGGPRGFGRHGRGRGPFGRGFGGDDDGPKRMLGHGDLRFLLLALLKDKPRHGYEIIKLLEEKSAGHYTPSPGVIYPTLTYLEEAGYATAETKDNKKQYAITDNGLNELKQNQQFVDAILERMNAVADHKSGRGQGLRSMFMKLRTVMFAHRHSTDEVKSKIAEILDAAIVEIKKLT